MPLHDLTVLLEAVRVDIFSAAHIQTAAQLAATDIDDTILKFPLVSLVDDELEVSGHKSFIK